MEKRKRAARDGKNLGDGAELFGDWSLYNPRAAWLSFSLLEASDWHHLPEAGGWYGQDEMLMEDLATLSEMAGYVRAQIEVNEAENA